MNQDCPLCGKKSGVFSKKGARTFFRCPQCDLIHLFARERLDSANEAARYRLHENNPQDQNYRAFLDQLLIPLGKDLAPGAQGLDYGCGPGPTVSVMMAERGFQIVNYDPVFFKDEAALKAHYDFITCTEAAEHFFEPARDFERLNQMLRPGGRLGLMTSLYSGEPDFESWHYAKDPTHVSFYSRKTVEWLAARYGWSAQIECANVILFRKPV